MDNEKQELETVSVKGVEIFSTGTWKGIKYEEKDIDTVISNFKNGVIEPYVKIGHDEDQPLLKEFSLGWVDNLYRSGGKLIADFKQVPKIIGELIEKGALKKKSVELFNSYKAASGKVYDKVLRAVAFFGANGEPALNNLNDFVSLYHKDATNCEGEIVVLKNEDKETISMETIEVSKNEYDALVSFKSDAEAKVTELEKYKADYESKSAEVEKITAELEAFKASAEKDKEASLLKEATEYIDGQINNKKLLPKYKDSYIGDYVLKHKNGTVDTFKEEIESRPNVIPSEIESDNLSEFKQAEGEEELDKQIQAYMKKNSCGYKTAYKAVRGKDM